MNDVDKQYLRLLEEIVRFGNEKTTRAGDVLSLFGKQLRFDLKEGFPLLTTKKVFTKGVIHELLWFLQRPHNSHGSMNIEYLVRNKVYIWNDDAYRWFNEWIYRNIIKPVNMNYDFFTCVTDDEITKKAAYEWWIENDLRKNDLNWFINMSKEDFISLVLQRVEIHLKVNGQLSPKIYRFGDLGPVYGSQWRDFNGSGIDQIHNIIDTLRTNPNDRRMLCVAFNPEVLDSVALPPCHVMFQFYARELTHTERLKYLRENHNLTEDEYSNMTSEYLDKYNVPGYGLSCMWTQRSVDTVLGLPFNIASYALLTHIIAQQVNMIPDELIGSLGDCHIYKNHMDGVKEQLGRSGYHYLPTLKIREVGSINDLTFSDIQITGYHPDPPIKFQLNVG